MHKKYYIGIFHSFPDLLFYLDDGLIFLGNKDKKPCVQIINGNSTSGLKTKEFLKYNNYCLKEKTGHQLEVLLNSDDNKRNSNDLNVFFVNTKCNSEDITSVIEELDRKDIAFRKKSFHFLNSDSYFDYYYQWKDKEKVETIGDPVKACKMINEKVKPF